jgi:hypothetical protein
VERAIVECDAAALRALIARCWLSQNAGDYQPHKGSSATPQLGEITLHPHQLSAVEQINRAIEELGGALLCDEVGLGKTYVALSVARAYREVTVVGPAVLRSMWRVASARARVPVRFLSFESLSRGGGGDYDCQFLIVDEAHHARNPATRRYAALAALAHNRPMLLVSATPIHNRRDDLSALLALFLGSSAESLDAAEISRCTVRRMTKGAPNLGSFPRVASTVWLDAKVDDKVPENLLALPPPIPPREGGEATTLVLRSLVRQWASSDDALIAALRRRIRRSTALASALEEGTYPSAIELESWVRGDEDVQLGFPSLLAPAVSNTECLLAAIRKHEDGLRELLRDVTRTSLRTRTTADALRSVRATHPGERIVAFSQYADTIAGLYREMRFDPRVCALTGRGASIASGRISREEALRLFAPRAYGARESKWIQQIELLLATDLLSEGVNLQDAAVVVHLDIPWTPARLEQRVGRVARMGSAHREVASYAFTPPVAAESVLGLAATIERKASVVAAAVGGMGKLPFDLSTERSAREPSVPEAAEAIRRELMQWSIEDDSLRGFAPDAVRVAAVVTNVDGFVALECSTRGLDLIVADAEGLSYDPRRVVAILRCASNNSIPVPVDLARNALRQLDNWSLRMSALAPSRVALRAKVRRAALRRLANMESAALGHRRLARLPIMERARETLAGPLDAATERVIAGLLHGGLPDDRWVEAVAALPRRNVLATLGEKPTSWKGPLALLLLVRR